jgi:hypothetical protein
MDCQRGHRLTTEPRLLGIHDALWFAFPLVGTWCGAHASAITMDSARNWSARGYFPLLERGPGEGEDLVLGDWLGVGLEPRVGG